MGESVFPLGTECGGAKMAIGSSTFLLFLLSLATLTFSQLDDVYFEHNCNQTSGNYTTNSAYETNLNSIISQFSTLTDFNYGFFNLSAGEIPDKVNSIALCRGDMNQADCNTCLNYTATELKQLCPINKAATAWSQYCLVRYSNRDLYGLLENEPRTCAFNPRNASDPDEFNRALSDLLASLSNEAAAGGSLRKYAAGNAPAGSTHTAYATVQCTPDMDQPNCSACLNFAIKEYQSCCSGRLGCRVLRPNCVLRFENTLFYNQTAGVPLPSPPLSPTASPPTTSFSPDTPPTSRASLKLTANVFACALFFTLNCMLLV